MRRIFVVTAMGVLAMTACGRGDDPTVDTPTATQATSTSTSEAPPIATTPTAPATARCEQVAFTPNSEDAASEITATGLTCDEARAFVREAGKRTSSGGPSAVTVDGYRCVRTRSEEEPLPRGYYECTSDDKKVTFVRS